MTTALNTNVLLDLFLDDPKFGLSARTAITQAQRNGRLTMTEIVFAELAPLHSSRDWRRNSTCLMWGSSP